MRLRTQGRELRSTRAARRVTPVPRSGAAAERINPTSKVRSSSREEIPHVQGKEQRLRFAGAALKGYTSKVRETQVRW